MVVSIAFVEILLAITCFLFLRLLSFNDGLPWNWPIIGMLPAVFFNFHRLHEKCIDVLERSKGTFKGKGVWFTNMEVLLTSDPINVQYITSKSLSNYPKGSDSKEIFEIVGEGLFNTDHDEWRKQRKMIHAFLNHQGFHRVTAETFGVVNLETGLVPVLDHVSQQDIVVDLQDLFERLMFDVACILATGYDPCCLRIGFPQVPFLKAMEGACEVMLHRHIMPRSIWKLQRWLGIGKEKIHSHAYKTIDLALTKYLSMKQEEMSRGTKLKDKDKEGFDMLKFFLTQGSEIYGKTLTDQIVKGNLLGLIFGVQDTTSIALTWLFWLISKNPSVETKIREEIQATFPSKEGEKLWYFVNKEEVSKLVYLHGALCEALRLFPPAPILPRTTLHPDILPSGHHVNQKTKILFSAYAVGRMASVWGKDCLEFKPERWISKEGGIKHEPSHKFFAFSAGPRTCPGKELGLIRMKAIAATIIHNYHVQVIEGQSATFKASIMLKMKHGLKAKVKKRWA